MINAIEEIKRLSMVEGAYGNQYRARVVQSQGQYFIALMVYKDGHFKRQILIEADIAPEVVNALKRASYWAQRVLRRDD